MVNSDWASEPEAVKENAPLYPVAHEQDKYVVPNIPHSEPTTTTQTTQIPQRTPRWKSWPALLILGLLIAIIAGLIGGFIGKAIQSNRQHNTSSDTSTQPQASTCPSTSPTPTPAGQNNTLALPVTGCPGINKTKLRSSATQTAYNIFCATDWVGSDISANYANSITDCVEACASVNLNGQSKQACMGATFIPAWYVNRTLSMKISGRAGNCFLKYNATGYPAQKLDDETVVFCLEGKCP